MTIIFASVVVYTYWNLEPSNVTTIKNSPVPVRPAVINPEAAIIVSPQICKHIEREAFVKRQLVSNAVQIPLPDYTNHLHYGCTNSQFAVVIPGYIPDGVYHIKYSVTYHINPIKDFVLAWETQNFTVHHVPPLPSNPSGLSLTPSQIPQATTSSTTNTTTTNTSTPENTSSTTNTTTTNTSTPENNNSTVTPPPQHPTYPASLSKGLLLLPRGYFDMIWHWIIIVTGTQIDPSTGSQWYNFWSGFGSDIGEVVIIGGIISVFRKHNCHVKGCWRVGKHPVIGTPYITCRKHHPTVQTNTSVDDVRRAYRQK